MDKGFIKTEPPAAPGPSLVAGSVSEIPPAPVAPLVSLSGDMGAPIARDYTVGDEFDGTARFKVSAIDGDNVDLELVNLAAAGGCGEETAEGAIDSYLAGKGREAPEEEML